MWQGPSPTHSATIVSSLKLCPTVHLDRAGTSSNKSESVDHSGIPTWPKVSTQVMAGQPTSPSNVPAPRNKGLMPYNKGNNGS